MALKQRRAVHDSGPRSGRPIWIVLHSTEGETAAGAAAWFANPASAGSAHIVVDDVEGYRCVPDGVVAWGAAGANESGLHMEHAARAAWKRTLWLTPAARRMLRRSALYVADWCVEYGIDARYLSPIDMRRGLDGLAMHYTVSTAFHQSTHWDPGKGFPKRRYLRRVKREIRQQREARK